MFGRPDHPIINCGEGMKGMEERCTALLLAAGSGKRMGTKIRKQYLELGGEPLFLHSVRAMDESPVITDIILMTPAGDGNYCRHLIEKAGLAEKLRGVFDGGSERYFSVAKGLEAISWPCRYVFIHDCARPFIDQDTIRRLYECVRAGQPCVAGMPSKDTIRITDEEGLEESTPDRSRTWIVQTPQVFPIDTIREAHRRLIDEADTLIRKGIRVTDDAMVARMMTGCRVRMIEATYRNIKVTTPEDIPVAEALLMDRRQAGPESPLKRSGEISTTGLENCR